MSETRTTFRKSSYSGAANNNCVEVAIHPGKVVVSETGAAERTERTYTPEEWAAFVGGVKDGEFDDLV